MALVTSSNEASFNSKSFDLDIVLSLIGSAMFYTENLQVINVRQVLRREKTKTIAFILYKTNSHIKRLPEQTVYFSRILNSVLRFICLPSSVSLLAMGCDLP